MLDTMTFTKILGAVCGSLLVLLLGNWAAGALYNTAGGHGDHAQPGYVVAVEGAAAPAAEDKPAEPTLDELLAVADVEKGAKAFGKCKSCHKLDAGAHGTGPSLFNVVERTVGTEEGFGYSGKLVAVAETWTVENLDAFLKKPKDFAPGTKMTFAGMKKAKDRANLIAYLATIK